MLGLRIQAYVSSERSDATDDLMSFLVEVVNSKLQSLSIDWDIYGDEAITLLVESWARATALLAKKFEPRKFELTIRVRYLPSNMTSLASLTHLHIRFEEAKVEDFLVLGGLDNLVLLNMKASRGLVSGRFIINRGIFLCLKVFSYKMEESWMGLEFEEGAMPQLQRLERGCKASKRGDLSYTNNGMDHLTCLTRVHVTIDCIDATISQVRAVEAALREHLSEIASKPTLELSREFEDYIRMDEEVQPKNVPYLRDFLWMLEDCD